MKRFLLVVPLFLSGCIGLGVDELYMNKGTQVYRAKCNGILRDIGDCLQLASEKCGGDFEVLLSQQEEVGSSGGAYGYSQLNASGSSNYNTNMYGNNAYTTGNNSWNGNSNTVTNSYNNKNINRILLFSCNNKNI